MLVTEGARLPVGLHLDSAQKGEVTLAQTTLERVRVQSPRSWYSTHPKHLVADKGYDSCRFAGKASVVLAAEFRPFQSARHVAGSSRGLTPGCRTTVASWCVTNVS